MDPCPLQSEASDAAKVGGEFACQESILSQPFPMCARASLPPMPARAHSRGSITPRPGGAARRPPTPDKIPVSLNRTPSTCASSRASTPRGSARGGTPISCTGRGAARGSCGDVSLCVRLRPAPVDDACVAVESGRFVRLLPGARSDRSDGGFQCDHAFDGEASQEEVFVQAVLPICESVMRGYNGAVIAYGQTGSGKTHTMVGDPEAPSQGIAPRAVAAVFAALSSRESWSVEVSVLEIYNERVRDLLSANTNTVVEVREVLSSSRGPSFHCPDAVQHPAETPEDALAVLAEGMRRRETAQTDMNHSSSRSHLVFSITVTQHDAEVGATMQSRFHLVDLAGSERLKRSMSFDGQLGLGGSSARGIRPPNDSRKEACEINKSLSQLALVIQRLTTPGHGQYIPYRDSMLTRLLADSFGGSSKTCLIVTCSATGSNREETRCSLDFGRRAKFVKNKAEINLEISSEPSPVIMAFIARQVAQLQKERDAVQCEQGSWQCERDSLVKEHEAEVLQAQRECDALRDERDAVQQQRDGLMVKLAAIDEEQVRKQAAATNALALEMASLQRRARAKEESQAAEVARLKGAMDDLLAALNEEQTRTQAAVTNALALEMASLQRKARAKEESQAIEVAQFKVEMDCLQEKLTQETATVLRLKQEHSSLHAKSESGCAALFATWQEDVACLEREKAVWQEAALAAESEKVVLQRSLDDACIGATRLREERSAAVVAAREERVRRKQAESDTAHLEAEVEAFRIKVQGDDSEDSAGLLAREPQPKDQCCSTITKNELIHELLQRSLQSCSVPARQQRCTSVASDTTLQTSGLPSTGTVSEPDTASDEAYEPREHSRRDVHDFEMALYSEPLPGLQAAQALRAAEAAVVR